MTQSPEDRPPDGEDNSPVPPQGSNQEGADDKTQPIEPPNGSFVPPAVPQAGPARLPPLSVADPDDRASTVVSKAFATQPAPTNIAGFTILETLGEGGMGTVYKAEQRVPLKRIVALKLMKPGMNTKNLLARFESERQALARMDHPKIAKVLEAGADFLGNPYFVMEYVPGKPITEFADENKLSIKQRLELFTQVCDAITHAHSKSILHRDIKAGNVLAYMEEGKPTAKVIDFGIAKALKDEKLNAGANHTDVGLAVGTYYSMSPEQADGSPDIDTKTDVYSLGVLLYELLVGAKPFDGPRWSMAANDELRRIIREVNPPNPSVRLSEKSEANVAVAKLRRVPVELLMRELRSELEWIPMKAMRKERERRYVSPLELAEDIQNYLNNRPLKAGPDSNGYLLRKAIRRNRTAVIIAASFLLFFLGAVGVYVRGVRLEQVRTEAALIEVSKQKAEAETQRAEAKRQALEARRQAATAIAVSLFQADMLSAADPKRMLGDKVTVLQAIEGANEKLDAGEFKSQPLVEAAARTVIGTTLASLGRYTQAEAILRRALAIRREVPPPENPDIALLLNNLAGILEKQQKPQEAEALYREALAISRKFSPPNDPRVAHAATNLATLLVHRKQYAEADALFREALSIKRAAFPPDSPEIASTINNIAILRMSEGKISEAEAMYREALEINRKTLPAGHPDIAVGLNNIAMLLLSSNRSAEAEPLFREALEMRRKVLPADHPDIAVSLINLGACLVRENKQEESNFLFNQAREIERRNRRKEASATTKTADDVDTWPDAR